MRLNAGLLMLEQREIEAPPLNAFLISKAKHPLSSMNALVIKTAQTAGPQLVLLCPQSRTLGLLGLLYRYKAKAFAGVLCK
jgi:hypothetical protein